MDDGCSQRELLLHAVGEVGDQLLLFVGEVHKFEQLFGALQRGGLVEAVHAADEAEILAGGQAAEQRHAFGNDADLALQLSRVPRQVLRRGCRMVPEVGASRPVSILMVVDLPAPLGPRKPKNCRLPR